MAHSLQDSYEDIPFSQSESCGSNPSTSPLIQTVGSVAAMNTTAPPVPPPPPPPVISHRSRKCESKGLSILSCFPCLSLRNINDNSQTITTTGKPNEKYHSHTSKSFGNNIIKTLGLREFVGSKRSLKRPQENPVDHLTYSDDNSNYPEIETISTTVSASLRNEPRALPPLPVSTTESVSVNNQSATTMQALVSAPSTIQTRNNENAHPRSGAGNHVTNSAVHSQVEYQHHNIHCLSDIYSMPCYWGVIDRYEAEAILENKAEGCFLLRDSAQDDFVFSVSFRRFNRTLHARLEQQDHRFTFDSHDPNIFAANSVSELLEHYKDPGNCMIYEPMCCIPVHRNNVFSLLDLCRGVIVSNTSYDSISELPLPKLFHKYLRYYHYKTPVRCTNFH